MSIEPPSPAKSRSKNGDDAPFSEAPAWRDVKSGWQPLFGSFQGTGFSIEWHDFFARKELDWSASFHPGCVELCLNLEGHGFVGKAAVRAPISLPAQWGFIIARLNR